MQTQLPVGQGSETGALVRVEPEKLPVTRASIQGGETGESNGRQGIIVRQCGVELELPEGMARKLRVEKVHLHGFLRPPSRRNKTTLSEK